VRTALFCLRDHTAKRNRNSPKEEFMSLSSVPSRPQERRATSASSNPSRILFFRGAIDREKRPGPPCQR
jgi:hypothetical protein